MISNVNFGEEIEKIAEIFSRNITADIELLEVKFELYSEMGDFHIATHAENQNQTVPVRIQSDDMDDLYDIFSSIRQKCAEKWYKAELKFFPDGTWNIEFVYGKIPDAEDE